MSMQLRYKGGFYSISQILYDVEIWQEGYSGQVQDIAFVKILKYRMAGDRQTGTGTK